MSSVALEHPRKKGKETMARKNATTQLAGTQEALVDGARKDLGVYSQVRGLNIARNG